MKKTNTKHKGKKNVIPINTFFSYLTSLLQYLRTPEFIIPSSFLVLSLNLASRINFFVTADTFH